MLTTQKQLKANNSTKDILEEVVLKLAQLDTDERNPIKLYLKTRAVEAVTLWLRSERKTVRYTRLAPI